MGGKYSIYRKETGREVVVDWIKVAKIRAQWRAFLKTVLHLRVA
jgi:hypothetical protein